ncbi:DJ-1/PfpI family protein [Marinomonas posidonica]|uniref:ThiJ/PfpI domain-containing protein n=1 Tax=Marinomonas posidonica (strain CECT 7376 / NCIMB 14433 / IVIA-Po-181) TaxID=491952 RepID=F6CSJ0_MARPP|nr:ThiJ/PfpI domain-containing protein [Marinomonas posidonica IVIA-Po-181]
MKPIKIGIYLYELAEVLDFSGPFEVFTTAARVSEDTPFEVYLISEDGQTVSARAGYKVVPDYSIKDHPELDVLLVVGGDHSQEVNKSDVLDWIAQQAPKVSWLASVCTGAFLLAKAGVFRSNKVTTHWEDIADLQQLYPQLDVVEGVRWVQQDQQLTSAGISAGIDMSLQLVSLLHSDVLAEKTARQMEFDWTKNPT